MNKIETCKTCTQKSFDKAQGIVCGLTKVKPTFEETCPDYIKDETVKPVSTEKPRPNLKRAKTAIMLVFIVMILDVVSGFSSYLQYDLLLSVSNGEVISQELAEANDAREGLVGIVYLIVSILSAITFIQWFRRAYYNLHLKVSHLSHPESGAASCWFIPIINLGRPYRIMKELYVETKEYLQRNGKQVNELITTSMLGVWWTLWIISGVIGQIVFRLSLKAEEVDELINLSLADLMMSVLGIPLALVTIKIIKDYSKLDLLITGEEEQALIN